MMVISSIIVVAIAACLLFFAWVTMSIDAMRRDLIALSRHQDDLAIRIGQVSAKQNKRTS